MPEHGPSEASGSEVRCSRCGIGVPSGTTNCTTCGCFLPSNEANLRHGLRRYQTTKRLPAELEQFVAEFRDELIADQGGSDEMTAVRAGMVSTLVDLEVGRRLLMAEVIRRGIDSRPGRAAYGQLLGTLDRWLRYAKELGAERRLRPVPTLAEVMEGDAD